MTIDITPAMVEAGRAVFPVSQWFSIEDAVVAIYRAMYEARPRDDSHLNIIDEDLSAEDALRLLAYLNPTRDGQGDGR